MKSDSRVVRIGGPTPEAFEALFHVLEEPFALCDVAPRLLAAKAVGLAVAGVVGAVLVHRTRKRALAAEGRDDA